MKQKLLFRTCLELNELAAILSYLTKKALRKINFKYENVYTDYKCGYTDENEVYEYFKVYINEKESDEQYLFSVDINEINQKNFYKKLKRELKILTRGIPLK